MSQPRGFGLNGKSTYTNVSMPKEVWLNFTVDAVNTNGLGVRSVKSNGYVESVFMHTSATPGKVGSVTNPNPAAGYAMIRFTNTFNYYLGCFASQAVPAVSTAQGSTTAGNAYVITSLGTTTLAQWEAAGLFSGVLSSYGSGSKALAVGQTFIATATGAIGGTGTVGSPGVPTAATVSVVGDPNMTIGNSSIASNAGALIVVQFAAPTAAGTTTLIAASPADGTVVSMQFCFDGSSVTIDGL